jgi:geranylgeranyl diphosphate synthase type II
MSDPAVLLEETLDTFRSQINVQLKRYVDLRPDCPADLREAMAYSLLAGGKRLRPLLVLLACEACGGEPASALPAACAIEMVHTYSLIHDDLPAMDDDGLRRGRPTCHIQFGEAEAILAGDALLTLAFEVIATDVTPKEVAAACCADLALAAGMGGMVGGQMADLQAEHTDVSSVFQLEAIHRRKTGRLISCALSLGARIAGASSATCQTLIDYGDCVGLAFQIADDLLDIVGNQAKMGKGVHKDADHGKLTYPSMLGAERSRAHAIDLIDKACEAIAPLGERGQRLDALAHFIIERDH